MGSVSAGRDARELEVGQGELAQDPGRDVEPLPCDVVGCNVEDLERQAGRPVHDRQGCTCRPAQSMPEALRGLGGCLRRGLHVPGEHCEGAPPKKELFAAIKRRADTRVACVMAMVNLLLDTSAIWRQRKRVRPGHADKLQACTARKGGSACEAYIIVDVEQLCWPDPGKLIVSQLQYQFSVCRTRWA